MVTSRQFHKNVAASEATLLEIAGGVVTGGISFVLENLSQTNSMVYRFQESFDRNTWVDVQFPALSGSPQSQFSIPPGQRHHLKLSYTRPYARLQASGNLVANISMLAASAHDSSAANAITITP